MDANANSVFTSAQAQVLGGPVTTLIATGNAQSTAALIVSKHTIIKAVTGTTGVILPSTTQATDPLFSEYYLVNGSASTASAVCYSPTSGMLNGTTNGAVTIAAGIACIAIQSAAGLWNIVKSTT